jgi:hypothetical protein
MTNVDKKFYQENKRRDCMLRKRHTWRGQSEKYTVMVREENGTELVKI